ncbi:MAG: NADH-quinone oxidoreductase subunit I [Myxococcales bacterium]|jgi:NADH-quinone oxidoreductase subunit I|nr:NADH-quinone oxidoreductase subunit I [Myxococcales bacterium]
MAGTVVTVERRPRPRAVDTLGPLAIVRGLIVTASHFLRNLMGFVRGKPTIFTIQYPEEVQKFLPAFRGMPVLVQMPNGKERCVACGLCEWACPVDCITIYPAETEDEVERYPAVFDIEMSRCMFCGLCEEACPEEAIVMSQRVAIATTEWRGSVWHKQDLLTPVAELETRLTHIRRGYERTGVKLAPGTRGST